MKLEEVFFLGMKQKFIHRRGEIRKENEQQKQQKKKSETLISKGIDMKGERKLCEEAGLTTGQPW